jgi:hypothetical protein
MLTTVLIFTILILTFAILALSVKILLKRGGKFSSGHIGHSKAMRDRGITCSVSTDARDRNKKNLSDILKEQERNKQ